MIKVLKSLSKSHLFKEASQVSPRYEHYIYAWQNLLFNLYMQNFRKSQPNTTLIFAQNSDEEMEDEDYPVKYLTLADVRRLSSYELLAFSEIEKPLKEQIQFSLSPNAPLFSLEAATIFVEIVLLLSLIYFYIFLCEAKSSPTFLAPATLFGAFSRTRLFRGIFLVLLFIPPLAATLLTIWSFPNVRVHGVTGEQLSLVEPGESRASEVRLTSMERTGERINQNAIGRLASSTFE
jgi:hypothetical protein